LSEIKNIKKTESVYLDYVYNYRNRTIGVRIIKNTNDLEKTWEDTQFELSGKYQYEGVNEHVWDYYLVFCCNFSEDDLDKKLRFKIESDRFCCRKYFLFGVSEQTFSKQHLVDHLFPLINSSKPIQIITAETIIDKLGDELKTLVPSSFFTEELDDFAVESLLKTLINRGEQANEE